MKVYSDLEEAQLQARTTVQESALMTARVGGIWWNTTTSKFHVADGTLIRALLRNDQKLIVGNSGTASTNVRLNRAGTSKLQFTKGDDTTAEGSIANTSIAELVARAENYTNVSKPTNDPLNAGRVIYNSTDDQLEWDNGTSWIAASSTGASGSVDAIDIVIDKMYQAKDRGLNELLPNSVADNFFNGNAAFQCYLLEDYTAAAGTLKMVVNPVFVETADKLTDAATTWTEGNTDTTLNAVSSTFKIGTKSLSFDKDSTHATTAAFIQIAAFGGSVYNNSNCYFWMRPQFGTVGNLASVFIRCGSSSTNYRQWNFTTDYVGATIANATFHLFKQDVSDTTGSTTGGTAWTTAENLAYFAVGIITDSATDEQAGVLVDGIFFADSTGTYAALGDQLTIWNASFRESFGIDVSSTTYNGLITLVAALANSYAATSATFIKRTTCTVSSGLAVATDGLSGTIRLTQEVRIRRTVPTSIVNKSFKAFATFLTGEAFIVTAVNASTSIVLKSDTDVSANWKSGRVVDVAQRVGDGNAGYDYVPRTDVTYTMTGNSTFSGTSLTLPMTNTGTVAVGDLVVKRQINCYSSVALKTANESFSAMTRDRIEIINPGIPYFYPSTVWAHWTLSGNTGHVNVAPGGGGSAGLNLTVNGTLTQYNAFTKARFASDSFSDANYYSLTSGASEPISGDSGDCTNFGLSFWFKATGFTGSARNLINRADNSGPTGWFVQLGSGSNIFVYKVDGTAATIGTFVPDVWQHAYVFFTDGGTQNWYLNGVAATATTIAITDPAATFYVGRRDITTNPATGVQMSDLVVWRNTTALTGIQVNSIYNNGNPNVFGPNGSGFKYRFSQLAQTGQKLSLKAEITREADSDDPALWAIGLVKT